MSGIGALNTIHGKGANGVAHSLVFGNFFIGHGIGLKGF
jgi:hypothetical protein